MKQLLISIAVLAICCAAAGRRQAAAVHAPAEKQTFVIRVLDAHSGKPMPGEPLDAWVGKGKRFDYQDQIALPPLPTTDKNGNAIITIPAGATGLSLVLAGSIPCEPHPPMDVDLNYSLATILTHGAVSENVCGKARAAPVPGVLIVFAKRRHWWQNGD